MKIIYTLMASLIAVFATTYVYMASEAHAKEFVENGQFEQKFVAYTVEQMLEECEVRGLYYNFEEGLCKLEPVEED